MAITLVLGAGASLANGLHFHKSRLSTRNPPLDTTFFEKIRGLKLTVPTELRTYGTQLLGSDPFVDSARQIRMEEFFKDLFHDFLQERRVNTAISLAYEQLLDLYVTVLRQTTGWMNDDKRKGAPVGRLIAAAALADSNVTILTFNHDLVIENEIVKRAQIRSRWCLEEGYGTFGRGRTITKPGSGLLFAPHGAGCDHGNPITVLKLHGSLNWYVRIAGKHPKPTVLAGGGGSPEVLVTRRRSVGARLTYTLPKRGKRGRSSWYTWPVVIPPVHTKRDLIEMFFPAVWADARAAVTSTDRLVFFGYSQPVADVESEKLFQRCLAANSRCAWIDVVNPDPATASRFAELAPTRPVRWYPSLSHFLAGPAF